MSPVEHKLNKAINEARIDRGFEEYLEILNTFYSDDVELSIAGHPQPIREKPRVASFLRSILVPLHVLAEIGCLTISVRHTVIPGDTTNESNSSWRLDLAGTSGKTFTVNWSTFRKWRGLRVAYEHHYNFERTGEALTLEDITLASPIISRHPAV